MSDPPSVSQDLGKALREKVGSGQNLVRRGFPSLTWGQPKHLGVALTHLGSAKALGGRLSLTWGGSKHLELEKLVFLGLKCGFVMVIARRRREKIVLFCSKM